MEREEYPTVTYTLQARRTSALGVGQRRLAELLLGVSKELVNPPVPVAFGKEGGRECVCGREGERRAVFPLSTACGMTDRYPRASSLKSAGPGSS